MSEKEVITEMNRQEFFELLNLNPGLLIIDLNATWCGPCKKIQPLVDAFFAQSPTNVITCSLDVDENFDFYAYMKSKRQVNGIPYLACWFKGNQSFAPNFSHSGGDPVELDNFFKKCGIAQTRFSLLTADNQI